MSKLRGPVVVVLVLAGLVFVVGGERGAVRSFAADALQSRLDFAICPNVTATTDLQTPEQGVPGCAPGISSPNNFFIGADNTCTAPPAGNDLGTFITTQNPLGAIVFSGTPNNCAAIPPMRGVGAVGAAITVSVAQRGFCPNTLTVAAHEGRIGGVVFPIGTLPLGSYDVTVTLPNQTVNGTNGPVSWLGIQVSGTLRIGTTFTETDTNTLATPSTNSVAALLENSFAGPGAGKLVLTKGRTLSGTDYYACGTISVAASVTFGRRDAKSVARVRGRGLLTGGTGNYKGIKGTFTLTGSYNTKTNRGTFVLRGDATY